MDSRKSDPNGFTQSKEIRKLLKMKNSRIGDVILKANVFEQAKLGNKLDLISHHQRSQEVNLSWKKQLLLRKQRNTLMKSKSTSAIVVPPRLLPPIKIKQTTISCQQTGAGLTGHKEDGFPITKRQEIPMDTLGTAHSNTGKESAGLREKTLACSSTQSGTQSSEKALMQWKTAVRKTREQIRKSKNKLPPLMFHKTHLDYEKDPRFARLIEQLVPNMNRRNSDGDINRKTDDVDDGEEATEDTDEDHEEEPNY